MHRWQFGFCLPSSSSSSPILDISGTDAWYGPSRNFGSLSLMSWIFTMNSDSGSSGRSVRRLRAWARRAYWAFTSRSSLWMAWMSPVLSSMVKVVPAPSPVRMYLMEPSPLSMSEWSWGCSQRGFYSTKDPFGAWRDKLNQQNTTKGHKLKPNQQEDKQTCGAVTRFSRTFN